jgi:Xaa-Pro aminopeptidase
MFDFEQKLIEVQKEMAIQQIDGWLLYDYKGSNPLASAFLEIPKDKMLTRRLFYWLPREGDPIKILPQIEPHTLDHLPGIKMLYKGWEDLEKSLFSLPLKGANIAMEYSPHNALPAVSRVDAGTVELLRTQGACIVSSANLLQKYTSVWSEKQLQSHLAAADVLGEVVKQTWKYIENSLKDHIAINEYHVQQFMLDYMSQAKCIAKNPPICAVNAHSADPHYTPTEKYSWPIKEGDFILLDLWCKQEEPGSVYADITRVGVAAAEPLPVHQEIFQIVKKAQGQATLFIKDNYEGGRPIEGWQVDQMCRDIISNAGHGEHFIHRTGHNIGEEVHGLGANLDNFETHDFRLLLPGTCFSVEPGIYLPDQFGVRLEYDIYLHPSGYMQVTGGIQEEIYHF